MFSIKLQRFWILCIVPDRNSAVDYITGKQKLIYFDLY